LDVYEAIRERRSVRKFRGDPVPEAVLGRLVEAARWAPSWAHTQCCRLVLVASEEGKAALQRCLAETNPAHKAVAAAPVVAVFCGEAGRAGFYRGRAATPRGDWLLFDVGLAVQNFMLAAWAEGLGTVCVGMFDPAAAAAALGVPEGVEVVALVPLGYADGPVRAPPRKPLDEFLRRLG
jgi:nitroreductase